jgi:large subunit ribosomal protein L34
MSFTYKPNKRKRAKTHGFLTRSKSKNGKAVLKRRRQKGRVNIVIKK